VGAISTSLRPTSIPAFTKRLRALQRWTPSPRADSITSPTTPFGVEQHDAQGNRIGLTGADEPSFYRYDYADRLVQVDAIDPIGTPVTVATYRYDALGRRIGKTVFGAGGLPPTVMTYVYDDTRDDDCDGAADDRVLELHSHRVQRQLRRRRRRRGSLLARGALSRRWLRARGSCSRCHAAP
jgi:hypothetical protein